MYTYSKPILGLSAIRSAPFVELVHQYEQELVRTGCNPHVVRFHLHSVAHFGVWLELEGAELDTIDDETVAAFERHRPRCRCPGTSRNRRRNVVSCVRVFVRYLRKHGHVPAAGAPPGPIPLVGEFLQWMKAHRSAAETTLGS